MKSYLFNLESLVNYINFILAGRSNARLLDVREAESAGVSCINIRNIGVDANFERFAVTCNVNANLRKFQFQLLEPTYCTREC